MDHPLDVLRREHRVIEQMSACLNQLANRAEAAGELDVESATEIIGFFRHFADGSHHTKEENHLIPLMESRGFSRDGGPTADMRTEHRCEHKLLSAMEKAALAVAENRSDTDAVGQFVERARRFNISLRDHIEMENRCMFPMAEQFLSRDDLHALQTAFREMDDAEDGASTQRQYLDDANRLSAYLGVSLLEDVEAGPNVACVHGMGKPQTEVG